MVIATLDRIPFCCPNELRTMSHANLIKVASTLNENLPKAFSIATESPISASSIRESIAFTLGITRYLEPTVSTCNKVSDSESTTICTPSRPSNSLSRLRLYANSPHGGGNVRLEDRHSLRFTGLESLPELAEPADTSPGIIGQSFPDISITPGPESPGPVVKYSIKPIQDENRIVSNNKAPRSFVFHPDTPTPVPRFLKTYSSKVIIPEFADQLVNRLSTKNVSSNAL